MPTTTWSALRQEIVRPFGLVTGTTSTNLATNTSLIDEDLTDLYPSDGYFSNTWFAIVTSNNNDGEYRRITGYTQSSGTIAVSKAWGSGDSSDTTFELMTVPPPDVQAAYNEARKIVFPDIAMVRDTETIVTGPNQHTYTLPSTIRRVDRVYTGNRRAADSSNNLLLNGDFEDWDADELTPGSQNNWTLAGSGATFNKEAQTSDPSNYMVLSGNNSGRLKVISATTTLLQTFTPSSSSYTAVATEGQECNLSAWVYCNTASKVKLYIETVVGSFHGGTGWELMKASATLAHNATTAVVGLSIAASNVAVFVDEIWMTLGQSEMMDVPYNEIRNWQHVPSVAGASDGGVIRFEQILPEKRRLRIVGRDYLSPVSVDSDTVEVDGELLAPLYDMTRSLIAKRMAGANPTSYWTGMADSYEESYMRAVIGGIGKRIKVPPVAVPRITF